MDEATELPPLFERLAAWIKLFTARKEVRVRMKPRFGKPTKNGPVGRAYPDDARAFAAHAASVDFAYDFVPPPPPPLPPPFPKGRRFALEPAAFTHLADAPFGTSWTHASGRSFFACDAGSVSTIVAVDAKGAVLWSVSRPATRGIRRSSFVVATDTHVAVGSYELAFEGGKSTYPSPQIEWLEVATGVLAGTTALPAPSASAAAARGRVHVALNVTSDLAAPTEVLVFDGPDAAPRTWSTPLPLASLAVCDGALLAHSGPVEGRGDDGALVFRTEASFLDVARGDLVVGDGDAIVGLDPATGALRWRVAGAVAPREGAKASRRDDVVAWVTRSELRVADVATGALRWSASLAVNDDGAAPSVPLIGRDHVLVTDARGWIRVYERTTGQLVDWHDSDSEGVFAVDPIVMEDGDALTFVVPLSSRAASYFHLCRGAVRGVPPSRRSPPLPPPPRQSGTLYLSLEGQRDDVHLVLDGAVVPSEDLVALDVDKDGTGLQAWYRLTADGTSEIVWDVETLARFPSLTAYLTEGAKRAFAYDPSWQRGGESPIAEHSLPISTPPDELRAALEARGATPAMASALVAWLGGHAALLVPKPVEKKKSKAKG